MAMAVAHCFILVVALALAVGLACLAGAAWFLTAKKRAGFADDPSTFFRDRPRPALFAETREGFADPGPLAPVTLKPCEVYYTSDDKSCNDGTFDTARAAYVAALAAIDGSSAAADRVRAAALRTAIAEIDALPGATGACKLTLPDPWRRAVSDPDDVMHAAGFPGAMHCFVPVGDATDYGRLAAPGAGVAPTPGDQVFRFHGSDAPDAAATDAWRRVEFGKLGIDQLADGFYCRLPAVLAARAADPRYDVGRGSYSTLMTFTVRATAAPSGKANFTLLTAAVDGDLLQVMRQFYDESCPDDGTVARLTWTPHLEAGALVLRTQQDACRKPFVSKTYDDKCRVGRPVVLKTYSVRPRPEVFGTTFDIQTTKAQAIADRAAAQQALDDARALLERQRARYDTVVDVLRLMLDAWDLGRSEFAADAVDDAMAARQLPVFAQTADRRDKYAPTAKPSTAYPNILWDDDGALEAGPGPVSRTIPSLPTPEFTIASGNNDGATMNFWGETQLFAPRFRAEPVQCPAGSYVVGVGLQMNNPQVVKPVIQCYNASTGVGTTVSLPDSGDFQGAQFQPANFTCDGPNNNFYQGKCYNVGTTCWVKGPGLLHCGAGCPNTTVEVKNNQCRVVDDVYVNSWGLSEALQQGTIRPFYTHWVNPAESDRQATGATAPE